MTGTLKYSLSQSAHSIQPVLISVRGMNQNLFALLSKIIVASAVVAIAHAGSAVASTVTTPADQVEADAVIGAISERIADASEQGADQLKDDDKDDDKKGDQDDDKDDEAKKLPKSCSKAVLDDVSKRAKGDRSKFRIVKVQKQQWSDGCLGLGKPENGCMRAEVPGYLVVVERDQKYWVYRTNESGSTVAFDEATTQTLVAESTSIRQQRTVTETRTTQSSETSSNVQFSQTIASAVYQSIFERFQVQTSELRVVEAKREVWSNGCLGLPSEGTCTQAEVPGWRVVVASRDNVWVYRTNEAGSVVAFDEAATQTLMAQRTTRTIQTTFRDVPESHWARAFIAELARLEIVEGFPDGSFRPNEVVTKAQFAAMIRKAFEKTKVRNAIAFNDVSSSYWAYNAILEAYETGFLGADSRNYFRPTLRLDRLNILSALSRGLQYTSTNSVASILSVYRDVTSIPQDARTLIASLTERGIIVNYPDARRLELTRVATRAEVCALLYQSLVSMGKVEGISSPYVVTTGTSSPTVKPAATPVNNRRNCNQGIGNGAEGCDPGNSRPHGGSNDEGGRTPGNK